MDPKLWISLFSNDGCIVLNKKLLKAIGIMPALIYSELLAKYSYFEEKGLIDEEGYFFVTTQNIKEETSMSEHQQRTACQKLEELGLIKTCFKKVPAKKHFKIVFDVEKVEETLDTRGSFQILKNLRSRSEKIKEVSTNNNNVSTTKSNNKLDKFKAEKIDQGGMVASTKSKKDNNVKDAPAAGSKISQEERKKQNITKLLTDNGVDKTKTIDLIRGYTNKRIREVVHHVIVLLGKGIISPPDRPQLIIEYLENNKEIPSSKNDDKITSFLKIQKQNNKKIEGDDISNILEELDAVINHLGEK